MIDALWIKHGSGLVPADEQTLALLDGMQQGAYVRTSAPRQPRSPQFHKLMMAILQRVVEHTWPRFADTGELMDWLKIKSGMVKEVFVVDGVVKLQFKSVSFASMDDAAFRKLSEKWLAIICAPADKGGLMPGTNPDDLLRG